MSIVDAISKAKRIAQQTQSQDVVSSARQQVPSREIPIPVVEAVVAPLPPTIRLEPAIVDVNVSVCHKHRVVLPGSEELLDKKVESAYRMLRTRLLQRARSQGWSTIGVTSACPDDGKTLTALNLALSLAKERNNEIVLLDLDMRNPSVFKCLDIAPPNHMVEYFEGAIRAEDLFVTIGVDNLLLAGGAQTSEKSSELLSSQKFEELIDIAKSATIKPLIIIDLPPVLITDDALVLAPRLDAILVVTSEGKTARTELQRAVETLSEFQIAGYVLNRSQDAVKDYGYY